MRSLILLALAGVWQLAMGCSGHLADPPVSEAEPLGLQMVRTEAQLKGYPFRALLGFEAETDAVFMKVDGQGGMNSGQQHTGRGSFVIERGSRGVGVKLGSLFSGSEFPGRWVLAGAYFYAERAERLTAVYEVDGVGLASAHVEIPARQWTPVMLDIAAVTDGKRLPIGTLRFGFDAPLAQRVWCDDVLVIDNSQVHVNSGWVIRERGFGFMIEKAGVFREVLRTPEASEQGWVLEEASGLRARFRSRGSAKWCTIYPDGRRIVDGKMSLLGGANSAAIDHHVNPGEVTIAAEYGRVERNSIGDSNNDGYAELSGSYQILAMSPRIELTLSPRGKALYCPVLEVCGLGAGGVLVNMEGRVVESVARLADGRVLVVLPGTLVRPTLVSLRVSQ